MAEAEQAAKSKAWRPLLEGDEAEWAWKAIDAVVDELRHTAQVLPHVGTGSCASGSAGLSLLFTYIAMARDDSDAADVAVEYYEHATEALRTTVMSAALYSGFSGIAWAHEHLSHRLFESEDEVEEVTAIDEALLALLDTSPWTLDYDLISGLAGFGIYALEGSTRRGPRQCLELVVTRLEELAIAKPGGRTWWTSPDLLPDHQREIYHEGHVNLGLAHGVPAAISILGRATAAGIAEEVAHPLCVDGLRWLMDQRFEAGHGAHFPHVAADGKPRGASRLAWCYGDPGVVIALMSTAISLDDPELWAQVLDMARATAQRPDATSAVRDAGLCHGSAGVAHLFHRMYRATGEPALAKAARHWFRRTLEDHWQPGEGVGGFRAWMGSMQPGESGWESHSGFLTGSAGVALALLAAVTDIEPAWDRLLLADLPVRH